MQAQPIPTQTVTDIRWDRLRLFYKSSGRPA